MKFTSPAKLNLFLRVLRKRLDGYHDLFTLMQAVDLADTISLELSPQDTFSCNIDLPNDNLVTKALHLFRTHTDEKHPVSICLDKKIPLQAGLGGGSSNAATTLWALNHIFQTNLSNETLIHLGSMLGSDVPFFFSSGRAICTGRGEIFQSRSHQDEEYTIYKFHEGASTADIFRNCIPCDTADETLFINDLQPITEKLLPNIMPWKETLPTASVMTGSGSAYFCTGKQKLLSDSWHAKTISRSLSHWY